MKISIIDRSLYFRGLMILIRKDSEIRNEEKQFMMRIGAIMGFEKKFCKNAIDEIINNKNIRDLPPRFSNSKIAGYFIHDAIIISLADKEIHEAEIDWLKDVARTNGIENILNAYLKKLTKGKKQEIENSLAANKLEWD
jgi:hypothetical protein